MKKLVYLIFSLSVFFLHPALAQQQFSDGEVVYSVKIDPPAGQAANTNFEGSTLVYSFKNYLFRSDIHIGQTTYINIHNSRTHSAVVLIDAGSNKYLIHMNEAQLKEEDARFQGVTFSDAGGIKEIAGYNCKKAMGKLKDGSEFTVYYAPDLVPENKDYSDRFTGLKGLPLEFTMTTRNDMKMTMTATKVTIAPQPGAKFNTPDSGYRLLTYNELQNMRNQR